MEKVYYVSLREESWISAAIGKEDPVVCYRTEGELQGKSHEIEDNTWDGLTTSNIGQMVDSKWLERLQGDANNLTEAMPTHHHNCVKTDVFHWPNL